MNLSIDPPADGPTNMARDLDLLLQAEQGQPVARVYSWDGLWVTLGRFQSPNEALRQPVPFIVRPTGGRAVLHGHDVTVAVAIPHTLRAGSSRSVHDVYRTLVKPLVQSLQACGLNARLAEDTPFSKKGKPSADCFAFSSPNDVVDFQTGLKVCGCALRVTDRAALLQVSIPYKEPLVPIEDIIVGAIPTPIQSWEHERFRVELTNALRSTI